MKKIAILGLGNHVKKNILPTFKNLGWNVRYFLVRDSKKYSEEEFFGQITDDFDLILSDKELDYIYIATPIFTHFMYAKHALEYGHNVICEKPITVTHHELNILEEIAINSGVELHQVVMYKHHNQFIKLKEILASGALGNAKQVSLSFKIPHLARTDIRYDCSKGGGALYDVGFYPLSAAFELFEDLELLYSVKATEQDCDVDLSGISVFRDKNDAIVTCQWAIGACYENKIVVDFPEHRLVVERAFSKASSYITTLEITNNFGKREIIETGADDQFYNMFVRLCPQYAIPSPQKKTIEAIEAIYAGKILGASAK